MLKTRSPDDCELRKGVPCIPRESDDGGEPKSGVVASVPERTRVPVVEGATRDPLETYQDREGGILFFKSEERTSQVELSHPNHPPSFETPLPYPIQTILSYHNHNFVLHQGDALSFTTTRARHRSSPYTLLRIQHLGTGPPFTKPQICDISYDTMKVAIARKSFYAEEIGRAHV